MKQVFRNRRGQKVWNKIQEGTVLGFHKEALKRFQSSIKHTRVAFALLWIFKDVRRTCTVSNLCYISDCIMRHTVCRLRRKITMQRLHFINKGTIQEKPEPEKFIQTLFQSIYTKNITFYNTNIQRFTHNYSEFYTQIYRVLHTNIQSLTHKYIVLCYSNVYAASYVSSAPQ